MNSTPCPVCNKGCEHISGMWFYYNCKHCGFEYAGSSGILFTHFVTIVKKAK